MKTGAEITKKMGIMWTLIFTVTVFGSQMANATPKPHFEKAKYRVIVYQNARRSCMILSKKRNAKLRHHHVGISTAANYSYKPMAESDELLRVRK
ncbi:MAG TPA: hypothetical protein PLX35_09805 [Cyclobacteriaceae bacterium]|nr:hypothetical protein [Cyclobacteriaceae bacterium]